MPKGKILLGRYSSEEVVAESIMVPVGSGDQLHIKRLRVKPLIDEAEGADGSPVKAATPIFMLHGVVEDGRVFYSRSGKGLAYFLASHGFDVFVADMRGKGSSWPQVKKIDAEEYGAFEAVTEDLPALIAEVCRQTDGVPWLWVTHGWGGVLATAYMARYSECAANILGVVHFASRRTTQVNTLRKRILVDWWWGGFGQWLVKNKGYLPGRFWGYGVSDEAAGIHKDMIAWSSPADWIDTRDGFDYQAAVLALEKPASLYFASESDTGLADADDIRDFMKYHGDHNGRLVLLGKALGNRRDYGAVDMLVHEDAEYDHFPLVVEWMFENGGVVTDCPTHRDVDESVDEMFEVNDAVEVNGVVDVNESVEVNERIESESAP